MGKFYDEIPDHLVEWIRSQEIYWVASAALSEGGHVNVSPKGVRGTFHLESPTQVWYEDMTGSGSETIAHLRENGRITIMFCAFQGAPRTVRLFGKGTVHEWGTPEYERFIPDASRKPGSRSVIVVEVHKVGASCGYAVPYFMFQAHRTLYPSFSTLVEKRDLVFYKDHPDAPADESAPNGLKAYWKAHSRSIDGLPSVECFATAKRLTHNPSEDVDKAYAPTTTVDDGKQCQARVASAMLRSSPVFLAGFSFGLVVATVAWTILGRGYWV